jgi:hypothetical protein
MWGVVAAVAACSALGGLAIGRWLFPIVGVPVILASSLLSGRIVARSRHNVGTLAILGAFAATAVVGVLGARIGVVWLRHELRSEIEHLGVTASRHQPVPGVWVSSRSGILQRAIIREDPRGNGIVARFPLKDGSAVEFFSNRAYWEREGEADCSEEIEPGWYWRFRCQQDRQ